MRCPTPPQPPPRAPADALLCNRLPGWCVAHGGQSFNTSDATNTTTGLSRRPRVSARVLELDASHAAASRCVACVCCCRWLLCGDAKLVWRSGWAVRACASPCLPPTPTPRRCEHSTAASFSAAAVPCAAGAAACRHRGIGVGHACMFAVLEEGAGLGAAGEGGHPMRCGVPGRDAPHARGGKQAERAQSHTPLPPRPPHHAQRCHGPGERPAAPPAPAGCRGADHGCCAADQRRSCRCRASGEGRGRGRALRWAGTRV